MLNVIHGAVIMASLCATLFFINFWYRMRDRFFMFFAVAFALLALNWTLLVIFGEASDGRSYGYLTRLAAFLLIIAAVIDKNRSQQERW